MIIIVIILFISLAAIQLKSMRKKKLWKEAIVYSLLMLVGFIYSLSIIYNFKLPTISKITTSIFEPIADKISNNLEE